MTTDRRPEVLYAVRPDGSRLYAFARSADDVDEGTAGYVSGPDGRKVPVEFVGQALKFGYWDEPPAAAARG